MHWAIPGDIPQTTVDDNDVRLVVSHQICNNGLHVWTVDSRDKVKPQQVERMVILADFSVVLSIRHFCQLTAFDQFITEEWQLSLLHYSHALVLKRRSFSEILAMWTTGNCWACTFYRPMALPSPNQQTYKLCWWNLTSTHSDKYKDYWYIKHYTINYENWFLFRQQTFPVSSGSGEVQRGFNFRELPEQEFYRPVATSINQVTANKALHTTNWNM